VTWLVRGPGPAAVLGVGSKAIGRWSRATVRATLEVTDETMPLRRSGRCDSSRSRRNTIAVMLAGVPACTGTSLRTPWDEALITGAVKARLVREYGEALTRIDVDTVGRTVYLRGSVPSEAVRDRAHNVALGVRPVRAVVKELTIAS
jgi:BON domain